jgi:hypothetical protein
VIERGNFGELLWQAGQLPQALEAFEDVLAHLRQRSVSDYEVVEVTVPRLWILCELGRMDEAKTAARAALALMQRMPRYGLQGCAYFLSCAGRPAWAAQVLGACAARERAGLALTSRNERRLEGLTRGAVAASLGAAEVAAQFSNGESLGYTEVLAMMAAVLAEPTGAAEGIG